jgi:2-(1,2-epoxy-1,2-dihydrophenyl)acetyl-CoA isomerase
MLPRLVGLARATQLAMLGEKVSGAAGARVGDDLRGRAPEELLEAAAGSRGRLAGMATRGLGLTKRGFEVGFGQGLDAQLAFEESLQRAAGATADYAEGVRAFVEKRKAVFGGH